MARETQYGISAAIRVPCDGDDRWMVTLAPIPPFDSEAQGEIVLTIRPETLDSIRIRGAFSGDQIEALRTWG